MKELWIVTWSWFLLTCPTVYAQHDALALNRPRARSDSSTLQTYIPTRNPLLPARDPSKPYIYTNGDLNPPSMPKFPPGGYIGYGLDMTQASPLNIESAADLVKGQNVLLNLDRDVQKQVLPGTDGKVEWEVPNNCNYDRSKHNFFEGFKTFENGSAAAERLANSDTVGGSYRCIKGDVSVGVGLKKELEDSRSWAFYAYVYDVLSVEIRNYLDWFNESVVENTLRDLPKWPSNGTPSQDTIKLYRDVFNSIGTHVITSVNYGSRLELRTSADNRNSTVAKNFESDVKASLQGLPSQGEFDGNIKLSGQYKEFENSAHNDFWCRGGNSTLCTLVRETLTSNSSYGNLINWQKTAQDDPDLTSLGVTELWSLLRSAKSETLRNFEISLQNAWTYMVENPLTHYTSCSLVVSAAWGEIGMMTPGAVIVNVEDISPSLGVVESSFDRIRFHTRDGQAAQGVRIQFKIRNNGNPFSIELFHGSNGFGSRRAEIEFIATPLGFPEYTATNDQTIDKDPSNRMVFRGIPADPRGLATGIFGNTTNAFAKIQNITTPLTITGPRQPAVTSGASLQSGAVVEPELIPEQRTFAVS